MSSLEVIGELRLQGKNSQKPKGKQELSGRDETGTLVYLERNQLET